MGKKAAKKSKQHAPSPSSSKKAAEPVKVPVINQVRQIKKKYPDLPRQHNKALSGVRREIRQARQPIYTLNRKIREAPTPYYARKFRKERRELEARVAPHLGQLLEKREDFKTLSKAYDTLRTEKKAGLKELKELNKALAKADEETDWKKVQGITYQILKLEGDLDAMRGALGDKITRVGPAAEEHLPEEDEDNKGWLEDPNNPYTIWEAVKQLDKDLDSDLWDYYVINGKRFGVENIMGIRLEAAKFWRSLKKPKTDTPRVLRHMKLSTKTVRYIPFFG